MKLNKKELKDFEDFIFKVSMDGFDYALENYPPKNLKVRELLHLDELEKTMSRTKQNLEKLMEENEVEYS